MKDDRDRRDDDRDRANGEDRKGMEDAKPTLTDILTPILAPESPPPAHDELDTAE